MARNGLSNYLIGWLVLPSLSYLKADEINEPGIKQSMIDGLFTII